MHRNRTKTLSLNNVSKRRMNECKEESEWLTGNLEDSYFSFRTRTQISPSPIFDGVAPPGWLKFHWSSYWDLISKAGKLCSEEEFHSSNNYFSQWSKTEVSPDVSLCHKAIFCVSKCTHVSGVHSCTSSLLVYASLYWSMATNKHMLTSTYSNVLLWGPGHGHHGRTDSIFCTFLIGQGKVLEKV